jgi:Tfp pilus assembly protein PilO
MNFQMTQTNRVIVAMVVVAVLGGAFWMLALSPKREEVKKLDVKVQSLQTSLAQHEAEIAEGLEAREEFPKRYEQLVVLGKAVPGDDDTASLLVQLNRIAAKAGVEFNSLNLSSDGGEAAAPAAPEASTEEPASPTEVSASLLPLGASIGPAGLAVMPYTLTFSGDFFKMADFIKGLDSLVKTTNEQVAVNGRLITIDGFSLGAGPNGFPSLTSTFEITTYLTPPNQGLTAGASPAGPSTAPATPVSTTTGGAP